MTSKLAAILRTFSGGGEHSLSDVARAADIPVSTAHRLVNELVEWGFLDRSADKRYCVGALFVQIGGNVRLLPGNLSQADQVLDDLSTAARAKVRLGVLDGGVVRCIEKHSTPRLPARSEVRLIPAHATAAGKVLLAFSDPEIINDLIHHRLARYTETTLVTPSALRRELSLIRMSQLAWCRGEFESRSTSISTPVFTRGGRVVAALEVCLAGPSPQLRLPAVQPALIVAARSLTRQFSASGSHMSLLAADIAQMATTMDSRPA